jgi:hypothetical protein
VIEPVAALPSLTRDREPLVFVRVRPAWTCIDSLREFCGSLCEATFRSKSLADRARLVIHETLENAVKYSTSDAHNQLDLTIWTDGETIEISVGSRPDPEHLSRFRAELSKLYAVDAKQAYLAAFRRAAAAPGQTSKLGLARIRYEAEVDLTVVEEEGGRIRVTASGRL